MSKSFGLAFGVLLACLVSAPAWAQQTAPPPPPRVDTGPDEPATNLSLHYAYMRDFSWDQHLFYGYVVTLSHRIKNNVAIVGEGGGSYGETTNGFSIQRYAFLGGVRLSGGEGRARPFFQIMSGLSRQGGEVGEANGIAVQPGGGVDFALTEKITLRGQGDFRWIRENGDNWTSYRFSGGLVIYLGKKKQ